MDSEEEVTVEDEVPLYHRHETPDHYGHDSREWSDDHYVPVKPNPGEKTKNKDPCKSKAVCLECSAKSKKLRYLRSIADDITHTARQHFVDMHKDLKNKRRQASVPSLTSGLVDEILVVFKCKLGLSFRSLDDPLIDFLLSSLTSSRAGRKTLATTVMNRLHDRLSTWVADEVASADFISLSVDSWSAFKAKRKYIGLHCNLFHSDRELKSSEIFLAFCFSTESETTEYLVEKLAEIFEEFKVSKEHLVALITDRGSNIKKVPKIMQLLGVNCAAHACHNAVEATLKSLTCLIKLVKDVRVLIAQFNRSTAASGTLESVQLEDNLDPKRVLSFSDTRWDSFFQACFRLLELGDEILDTIRRRKLKSGNLDNPQLRLLFVILRLLKPIKNFTDKLIDKDNKEHITILTIMRSSVDLFVDASTNVFRNIQAFWKSESGEILASVDLDEDVSAENVHGLSAAVSVLFLQFLRRYLFKIILDQFEADPTHISVQCVGASLDAHWKTALETARHSSPIGKILECDSDNMKIQGFSDAFLEFVVKCKDFCGFSDYDNDDDTTSDDHDSSSQSAAPSSSARNQYEPQLSNGSESDNDSGEMSTNAINRLRRNRNFAQLAENAVAAFETEEDPQDSFEYNSDDATKPLVSNFKVVDVQDMVVLVLNLYSTFVQDIYSIDGRLSDQLKLFCSHLKLYEQLKLKASDDTTTAASPAESDQDDDDDYLAFHGWNAFDSQLHATTNTSLLPNTLHISEDDLQHEQFWDDLRQRSHLVNYSVWLGNKTESCNKQGLLTLLHQALSTVPATSVSVERDFSTATQLQSDLRVQLNPHSFAKEVYIARNYALLGFTKFAKLMTWTDKGAHRKEELRRSLLQSVIYTGPQLRQTTSTSTVSLESTPVASRRTSTLELPTALSSPSSTQAISRSLGNSAHVENASSNMATSVARRSSRTSLESLAKVADLEARVFAEDGFELATGTKGSATTDSHDMTSKAVKNVREHCSKRKAQTASDPTDAQRSQRRQTVLSYLNTPDFTQNTWKSMIADDRCGLKQDEKLLNQMWTFATTQSMMDKLISKLKDIMRDDEGQMDVELPIWRRDMESTISQARSQSGNNPSSPAPQQPSHVLDPNYSPNPTDAVSIRFGQLPGLRFIPARYPTLKDTLLANHIKLVKNAGRGNCFFESAAQAISRLTVASRAKIVQLVGEDLGHLALRQIAVRHITQHWDNYKNFRTPHEGAKRIQGKDKWLQMLATPGTWADHISVQALAIELRLEFLILRDRLSEMVVSPTGILPTDSVNLVLHGEQHYESTMPMKKKK